MSTTARTPPEDGSVPVRPAGGHNFGRARVQATLIPCRDGNPAGLLCSNLRTPLNELSVSSGSRSFCAFRGFLFAPRFFGRWAFRLRRRFVDGEVFPLFSFLNFGSKPPRHCATPSPGFGPVLRITIFGATFRPFILLVRRSSDLFLGIIHPPSPKAAS